MMKKTIMSLILLAIFASGCQQDEAVDYKCYSETPTPLPNFESRVFKHDLRLYIPENMGAFSFGDDIVLLVENLSEEYVWIPEWYNLRIYRIVKEDTLQQIFDKSNREGEGDIILGPKGSDSSVNLLLISPEFGNNTTKEQSIFITVFGYVYRDGQYCEDKHGGTIEVTVYP